MALGAQDASMYAGTHTHECIQSTRAREGGSEGEMEGGREGRTVDGWRGE